MSPTIKPPRTGTSTANRPSELVAGEAKAVSQRWKKKRLVNKPMSLRSAEATTAPSRPIPTATREIGRTRAVVVKSPRSSASSCLRFCDIAASLEMRSRVLRIASTPNHNPHRDSEIQQRFKRSQQCRSSGSQLGAVERRKERKERLRIRCKLDGLLDPAHDRFGASDKIARFHSSEEFHGAAVLHLQLLHKPINRRSLARWRALHGKEQLVFLRIEA